MVPIGPGGELPVARGVGVVRIFSGKELEREKKREDKYNGIMRLKVTLTPGPARIDTPTPLATWQLVATNGSVKLTQE